MAIRKSTIRPLDHLLEQARKQGVTEEQLGASPILKPGPTYDLQDGRVMGAGVADAAQPGPTPTPGGTADFTVHGPNNQVTAHTQWAQDWLAANPNHQFVRPGGPQEQRASFAYVRGT